MPAKLNFSFFTTNLKFLTFLYISPRKTKSKSTQRLKSLNISMFIFFEKLLEAVNCTEYGDVTKNLKWVGFVVVFDEEGDIGDVPFEP